MLIFYNVWSLVLFKILIPVSGVVDFFATFDHLNKMNSEMLDKKSTISTIKIWTEYLQRHTNQQVHLAHIPINKCISKHDGVKWADLHNDLWYS
jgi:hypothetical protein